MKSSQPSLLWLVGWFLRTVKTVLSRKTPCLAQRVKSVFISLGSACVPVSDLTSLKIFNSDGGAGTPSGTEKAKP